MTWNYKEEQRGEFGITATVKGDTKEQRDKGITWYCNQNHPAGYGTSVVSRAEHFDNATKKTEYVGILHRYHSCD